MGRSDLAKLVLTISEESEGELIGGQYRFNRYHTEAMAKALDDRVVFCTTRAGGSARCFAVAHLWAIEVIPGSGRLLAKLDQVQYLASPVDLFPDHGPDADVGTLADEEYDRIISAGGLPSASSVPDAAPGGFAEPRAPFYAAISPGFSRTSSFAEDVLATYDYRCAFTGNSAAYASKAPPRLDIVAIVPVEDGGAETINNFIAAAPGPLRAFEAGHITIGERREFIVALDRLDPELLECLNPNGRLTLPAAPHHWPAPAALARHRERFNR